MEPYSQVNPASSDHTGSLINSQHVLNHFSDSLHASLDSWFITRAEEVNQIQWLPSKFTVQKVRATHKQIGTIKGYVSPDQSTQRRHNGSQAGNRRSRLLSLC